MDLKSEIARLESQVEAYGRYRANCLNLIASENVVSPFVLQHLGHFLEGRYGDYNGTDLAARRYRGTGPLVPIEETAVRLIGELFGAAHVDLRPLSGHAAGVAVLLGLCRPGDTVLELDRPSGGHRLAEKLAVSGLIDLKIAPLPFDAANYNVDAEAAAGVIRELRPRVVILGSSLFLFPHPVAELKEAVRAVDDCTLVYDASHVLGLIAGGLFQKPLEEGADVIVTSTHKTLGGPQGGMIMTNDRNLAERLAPAVYPALTTNHHLARIPALAACALETMAFGKEYAQAVVANAKALAAALEDAGLPVVGSGAGYTESHTVLVGASQFGGGPQAAARLEQAGIICGEVVLPEALGGTGLRLGVQELTRLGMEADDTPEIAQLIAGVVRGEVEPEAAKPKVRRMAGRFTQFRYTGDQGAMRNQERRQGNAGSPERD